MEWAPTLAVAAISLGNIVFHYGITQQRLKGHDEKFNEQRESLEGHAERLNNLEQRCAATHGRPVSLGAAAVPGFNS